MKTFKGKEYTTKRIGQSGSKVEWMIESEIELLHDEVEEAIECFYPHAGYGSSSFYRLPHNEKIFQIKVVSNASCD